MPEKPKLKQLTGLPPSDVGAPMPCVLSTENQLVLMYYIQDASALSASAAPKLVDPGETKEPVAVVTFSGFHSYKFGSPNDETLHGHPLYDLGLKHYGFFVIENSGWINELEKMNAVHPGHNKERFRLLKHFIFTFHDSTFECVASEFAAEIYDGPIADVYRSFAAKIVSC